MSKSWTPTSSKRLPDDGWYLVTWRSQTGERFLDYSQFSRNGWFEDRWGCNAEAIAWMCVKPYGGAQ